jgi:hypothetical protein
MRLMRLFMVCLLSLGVAVQGHASVRVMDVGCPMAHVVPVAQGEHGAMDHAHMHDAGMATAATGAANDVQVDRPHAGHDSSEHGRHCQQDAGCQSAAPAIAATMNALLCAAPAMQAPAAPALCFRSHIPPLLARPPAAA